MKTYGIRITVDIESNMADDDSHRKCDIVLTSVGGYLSGVSQALGSLVEEVTDMLYSDVKGKEPIEV